VLHSHGHWFGSLPRSSTYQFVQPLCQTVPRSASRSSRSNASAASARTSIRRASARSISASAAITCPTPASIVKITDPLPPFVFGP